jgi:hypothetical protein
LVRKSPKTHEKGWEMNVLRSRKPTPQDAEPRITYRIASSPYELEQAFGLVYEAYVRVGLEPQRDQGIRLTKYHLWPETRVFVAVEQTESGSGRVVGTLSVVPDSVLGLPAEVVAAGEIQTLRSAGRRAAEFIALASDEFGRRNRVTIKLFRFAFEFCRANGISTILAALTERHVGFYRRFVGFRSIGEMRPYAFGNGTPVQVHALHVDRALDIVRQRAAALERDADWRRFAFGGLAESLAGAAAVRPWRPEMVSYFIRRAGDLARQLDRTAVKQLEDEYRRYGVRFPAAVAMGQRRAGLEGAGADTRLFPVGTGVAEAFVSR